MMPNVGPLEIVIVLIIALIVLGPKKLPEAARSLGRGWRELRDSMSGFGDDDEEEEEDDEPHVLDDAEARAEEEDRAALPPA